MDEIEGLVSADYTFWHGKEQAVLSFLGEPVLYGPPSLIKGRHLREEAEQEFKERIARVLGRLLMAEGGLGDWQTEPLSDED
jgi:hypothetical protein